MTTLSTLLSLVSYTSKMPGFKNKYLGLLLTGLTVMGHYRVKLRRWWIKQIDRFALNGDDIELRLFLNNRVITLAMRPGNEGDYIVGGELIKGIYEPPVDEPDLIIDGGANIGIFAIYAASYFPNSRIICYEPDPNNYKQLKKNLENNHLQAEAYQLGLWSSNKCLYFHAASSETGFINELPSDTSTSVNCVLPSVSNRSWLKLDVEGAEYEILPTLFEKHQYPFWISMEIHELNTKGQDLVDLLRNSHYEIKDNIDFDLDCAVITASRVQV